MLPYLIALSGLVAHVPDCPYVSRAGAMRVLGAPVDSVAKWCTVVDGTQLISIGVGGSGMSRALMAQRGLNTPGAYSEPIRCARKM
jgi:hypothetical protein